MLPLLAGCHQLVQPENLWEEAGELGAEIGRRGAAVKSLDLLIATYALSHGVAILSADRGFATIRKAGIALLLLDA